MRPASELYTLGHLGQQTPDGEKHKISVKGHYVVMAVLLAVAILISIWVATAPTAFSAPTSWSGFALFWLGGGLITLFLLTLAAKR